LYVNDKPGSLAANVAFSSSNDSVNDAAANTFNDPLSFGDEVAVVVVVDAEDDGLLLLPHAPTASANTTTATET